MHPVTILTLLDYARIDSGLFYNTHRRLTNANTRRALFDSRTVWMSHSMLSLWNDRRDKAFWRKFAAAVEVVRIKSVETDWREAF